MRKVSMFVILTVFFPAVVFAHTPEAIDIKVIDKKIEVTVTHVVSNENSHYVKRIEVSLNGEEAIEQKYTSQPNKKILNAVYLIPSLKPGDKLVVEAVCNKTGHRKEKFTVE